MPYSNPQTELLSQLIHQFIVAPVFPDGQSPEELEITQKIVTSLNELKDRNSALSQISSNGDTLFVSMVIWSDELRPVEDKENKKLEAILRVFDTHLSAEDWLWFMTSVTEANFEILLGLGPRTLIIQTLVQFTSKITKNPRFKKDLQILSKVLLSAQFRHTNLAVATEQVNNIHGAVILDSIFKSSDLKEITTLIDAQKTEPQFILGSLLELESLKQFARHLNQINSDYAHTFFQTTFNELVFNKMNLLSFSIFFKKGELFRFLLEECKVNPRYTGDFMSDEDCISFLLLKCCEDQAYYPFFISILPWLEIYVQTYNQGKNPDRWLRHPYQPDANFIPLVFMLSHKGERFVQFLMKHIAADWLKLLSTRNVKTFYPIWIPYIEPYYSVTPNYLTDYVDATRHLKKPMDAFKLIYALVQSLSIKNDPIATNENQKKIFVAFAKQVLDNSLRYPDLLQIGREYIKHPIEAKESSFTQLQQLAKDENFLTNIKSIVKKLPKSNLISLLIIHGILSILDKQSQDTNLQDLLEMKQPGKDLTDLVSFIESLVKSCAYPEYLYEMAVHYGFDKLESKLWSDLKQMKTLSGNSTVSMKARLQGKLNQTREKKKENFYPIESKKDALPESAEHALEMKINWLQFSLDGTSSTPLKQEKIDADMKTIAQELSAYLGPKGQQFSKDYKALQLLRMKYVEHNGNLELKVCSPKNPKKKEKTKKQILPICPSID